jgi:hypothetical protein
MRTEHTTRLSHSDIFQYGEKKLFPKAEDIILNYALVEWSINFNVREYGIEASIDINKVSINWEVDGEERESSHIYKDLFVYNLESSSDRTSLLLSIKVLQIDFEVKKIHVTI